MPWTEAARAHYARADLRYASDTRDPEWAVVAPLLPADRPLGRPRLVDLRDCQRRRQNVPDGGVKVYQSG